MVGVPVIINHKDLTDKNVDDERVGVVNSVWYDNKDGWYWCDGIIWNETAQNLITDKNWSVSCSYDVKTANDEGGSENNIKYDMEFLDGVFTHLALVNNPRYERANIVFNSKTEIVNDKWITIHPNGEDGKGRHLLLKDGETPKEAIERTYSKTSKKDKDGTESKANKEHLDKALRSVEKIMDKGQIDRFKKHLERFSDLSKVNLEDLPSQIEKAGGVDKALETLDKQAKWEDKYNKAQKLKNKFYDYVEKNDFKDERIYELSRFIGGFDENDFVEKVPSFEEFKKDNRYNFRTELALKYLADKKGDGFDNYFKDAESDKVKLGYKKFLDIIGKKDVEKIPDKKEDKKEDKVAETKILEGGIKESQDKYGRTKFTKENKWADVTSNGGRSDSWIASYGQSYLSPVSWEREKGVREEQLFDSRSFKTEKGARKWALEQLKRITNDKEQEMALIEELKKLITKVENDKGEKDMEIENAKVDKRKLIDEVGGILKGKIDDEIIRTIIGKLEKVAYDESEAGTADNEKEEDAKNCKAKNEDDEKEVKEIKEEVKEDVENCGKKGKVENAKEDYFSKLGEIVNSVAKAKEETSYVSRADREKAAEDYFAK